MHAVLPLLKASDFPPIRRKQLQVLQINLGYKCNQSCIHCHVNAGPQRTESMSSEIVETVLAFVRHTRIATLDITGGAPELNPNFRHIVMEARKIGTRVIDRCNLTVLEEPGYQDLGEFLAHQGVNITASLPCYLEENVDRQRGKGVFEASIRILQKLNALRYGVQGSNLMLDLVYNPQGPVLPPPQASLEADYKKILGDRYGIVFNRLLTLTNMPIQRFGSTLISKGQFDTYMTLLREAHQDANLENVMCRNLISVDWQGFVFDCDFNQMLGMPLAHDGKHKIHLSELFDRNLEHSLIAAANHCYGCTAGQGSSCGGALA